MNVTATITDRGDLQIAITFDSDAERSEYRQLAVDDIDEAESRICEAFFNGNYRFWTDEDQERCGDTTGMVGLTTISDYDESILQNLPEGWEDIKTVEEANIRQYREFADTESWFFNSVSSWIVDLINDGRVVFTARLNLVGKSKP